MSENNKKSFIPIIFLSIIIVVLLFCSFILSSPQFEISTSIITLLCILVIVVLSNSFDNFSLGKLFTMSRNVSEYKKKNEQLEKEKNELILKFLSVNIQAQNSSNSVIINDKITESLSVRKANQEEIDENKREEENNDKILRPQRIDNEKLNTLVLNKYFGVSKIDSVLRDAKVVTQFQGIDPISDKNVIFDAFYNDIGKENFIKIQKNGYFSMIFHDRLYVLLNKVFHYRNRKNSNACLFLLIAKLPNNEMSHVDDRFKDFFAPAIASGLLNIQYIDINEKELDSIYIKQ
jgi:ABC-type multidrug transport system fused ATPase/permease subunit